MSKEHTAIDTREHLLGTGAAIILNKGFSATGLAEILQTAGVPKGSFYHYFRSKEGFGVDLLERYFADYLLRLDGLLASEQGPAADCLLNNQLCVSEGGGCLTIKLAAEVSDLSELMRETLARGTRQIVERLSQCIVRGQSEGNLPASLPAEQTASALYSLWIGSALLAKVQQTRQPLELAMQQTRQMLGISA